MTEGKQSPRGKLRAWFEERIDGQEVIDLASITLDARKVFFSDREWCDAMFGRFLAQELRSLLVQMRSDYTVLGDQAVGKKSVSLEARAERLASKWGNYWEHVGDKYVSLFSMKAPDLLQSAAEREKRGHTQYVRAAFNRYLASKLKDNQTVGDVFDDEQLDQIMADIEKNTPPPGASNV